MTSGRTGCGAYPNARCFTYSLTLKPHFLASTAILLFSWSVTRNAIRFSFFINQLLVSSLFGGLGNAPKISPVSGLEGELAAHKFPACYTTGQPLPSVDSSVRFSRSTEGLFLDFSPVNIPVKFKISYFEMTWTYEKAVLCKFPEVLTALQGITAAVFSNFAAANHQMRWRGFWGRSCSDGISLEKRRHFVIPCRRKHPKTPAFARRFPVMAGESHEQAEKRPHFQPLSVPPEASAEICP